MDDLIPYVWVAAPKRKPTQQMDGYVRMLTSLCRFLLSGPVERSVLHMLLCSQDGRGNPTAKWAPRAAMLSASLGMPSDSSQWGPEGTLFVEQAVLAVRFFLGNYLGLY